MSSNAQGKTVEAIKVVSGMLSERITAATIYYNGAPYTNAAGNGFDSQPFEDCVCAINIGTLLGAVATLKNSVYESDTDDPSAATAISGAAFADATSSTDEAHRVGSIQCRDTKRYLFLVTEAQGTPLTIDFGATWIGGKPDAQATDHTVVFDV